MNHLKSYNESFDDINDKISFIKECFIDFIDDEKFDVEIEHNTGEYYDDRSVKGESLAIAINIPHLPFEINKKLTGENLREFKGSIEDFLSFSKSLYDVYLDIEVSLKRILDKYPDINYRIIKEPYDQLHEGRILSYIWIEFKL